MAGVPSDAPLRSPCRGSPAQASEFLVAKSALPTLARELANALGRVLTDDVKSRRVTEQTSQRADRPARDARAPVDSPPRPFLRPQADLPAAISACMPSTSCSLRPLTSREPSNGLMWVSIRLRSILSVDALIGRRLRPRMRPASACPRYQSQTSLRDRPARTAWRSADGSSPLATAVSFMRARSRATSGVSAPYRPSTNRRVRPSTFRYWMRKVFTPDGFTRTPKPLNSLSHANTSRCGSGRRASTVRFIIFVIIRSYFLFRACS